MYISSKRNVCIIKRYENKIFYLDMAGHLSFNNNSEFEVYINICTYI